jgi:MFS family permease
MVAVLLGVYLPLLGCSPVVVGAVVTAGLVGAAVASLVATLAGDRAGRRRLLVALALLGAAAGAALTVTSQPAALAAVAFVGMVNGMGRDRGASLVVEQAMLPATTTDAGRTQAFAWYNVVQDAGHAAGGAMAALPALVERVGGLDQLASFRVAFGVYAALVLATAACYAGLSAAVETDVRAVRAPVTAATRAVLWRISSLFALDSVGGGFLTTALLALFFHERFGAGAATVGALFLGARVANALSHLAAAWLARRIGLLNTMILTHVPSSLLLVTVAWAPSFPIAALLFLVREGLVEMDVPTRQSYVMAVVRPEERLLASGVTHLVRLAGWAVAPAFAGLLMQHVSDASPLVVGAAMKLGYDGLLYMGFRNVRAPEESSAVR